MLAPGMQRVTPLKEITMSDERTGASMVQEDFEEPGWSPAIHSHDLIRPRAGRRGIPGRLITLVSATMALGMLACTSEETPTEPAVGASPELAAVKTYTAVDL